MRSAIIVVTVVVPRVCVPAHKYIYSPLQSKCHLPTPYCKPALLVLLVFPLPFCAAKSFLVLVLLTIYLFSQRAGGDKMDLSLVISLIPGAPVSQDILTVGYFLRQQNIPGYYAAPNNEATIYPRIFRRF